MTPLTSQVCVILSMVIGKYVIELERAEFKSPQSFAL
jgi:hypothetical protein